MTQSLRSIVMAISLLLTSSLWSGCHREEQADSSSDKPTGPYEGQDRVRAGVDAFRYKTRGFYNNRNFQALEKTVAEVRAGAPVFGNGSWKLYQFYDSLECGDWEPDSMWQLHERIHKDWEKAYPQSITARIAHADFLVSYAWQARGSGYANTVTAEGWRLMKERLVLAQQYLVGAKSMTPRDPMWWDVEMHVALGQGWNHADMGKVYAEAKQVAPQFPYYDSALAYYLLPRWHGQAGDWEKAAAAELQRPNGLGTEGYARVVLRLHGFYGNIFRETQASWPNTRAGLEVLRKKYPQSLEILSQQCKMACLAEDRSLAQALFQQLDGYVDDRIWGKKPAYTKLHDWATGGAVPPR